MFPAGGAGWFVDGDVDLTSTNLRLSRERALNAVIAQRQLGVPETIEDSPLMHSSQCVGEDDTAVMSIVGNATLFSRLLAAIRNPSEEGPKRLEQMLASASPYFCYRYTLPISESTRRLGESTAQSTFRRASFTAPPICRKRTRTAVDNTDEGARTRTRVEKDRSASASGGLVAQSMKAWESHLTAELQREGASTQSFRQGRAKDNFLEKQRFQEDAEWREYQRELQLSQRSQTLQATRAIRRGESKP